MVFPLAAVAQSAVPTVLRGWETADATPAPAEQGVMRRRAVTVDVAALDGLPSMAQAKAGAAVSTVTLRWEFFDDASLLLDLYAAPDTPVGREVWRTYVGEVAGMPSSSVIVVERGGIVAANVRVLDRQYQIRYRESSGHEAREVDTAAFPVHHAAALKVAGKPFFPDGSARPSKIGKAVGATDPDDGTTIDAMVMYTVAAQNAGGGASGMASRVAVAVGEVNAAFAASGVLPRLRAVYAGTVSYVESGSGETDLTRLRDPADGFMDDVHTLRDAYGADLVSLWVQNPGAGLCGIAYGMTTEAVDFAPNGFSVVGLACASGNLTFGHELGHNMGLFHDAFVETVTTTEVSLPGTAAIGTIDYAHGYVDVANRFITLMAYFNRCSAASVGCARINRYSNPDLLYNGAPTGTTKTNSAAVLNATRETVARFRRTVDPPGPQGVLSFASDRAAGSEGGSATVTVRRLIGAVGAVSVDYATRAGSAQPGADFTAVSGTLTWAAGDQADKSFTVPLLADDRVEGDEDFTVVLSNPTGGAVMAVDTATVTIRDANDGVFPRGCALPAANGWSTPATATTGWQAVTDSAYEGRCSLKSISPGDSPSNANPRNARLQFTGDFIDGNVVFARRVSSESGWDCLRFTIDGVAQGIGGNCNGLGGVGASGEIPWGLVSVPIPAGTHTLAWSYEKDDSTASGADAAWIDLVSLPLALTPASRTVSTTTLRFTAGTPPDSEGAFLEATVAGMQPTGTVNFVQATAGGPLAMCTRVALVAGRARCTIPTANRAAGTQRYAAHYTGDDTHFPSSGATNAGITSASGVFAAPAVPAVLGIATVPIQPRAGSPFKLLFTAVSPVGAGLVSVAGMPGCLFLLSQLLPGSTDTSVAACDLAGIGAGSYSIMANYLGGPTDPPTVGTASAAVTVLPASGSPDYTDLWWAGAAENGWGLAITQHGDTQFNALYVYDAAGKPVWYVMPGGTWSNAFTRYAGPLYQPTSAPYFAYGPESFKVGASVGTLTIDFTSTSSATLSYTIAGQSGSKTVVRQPFGTPDTAPRLAVGDLWWGADEQNGWGISIAQAERTLFAVWFTYGADGKATWFVLPGGSWSGNDYSGPLYATAGPRWLGAAYNPLALTVTPVGDATLSFFNDRIATFRYTVNGVTQSKTIYRQPF